VRVSFVVVGGGFNCVHVFRVCCASSGCCLLFKMYMYIYMYVHMNICMGALIKKRIRCGLLVQKRYHEMCVLYIHVHDSCVCEIAVCVCVCVFVCGV